MADIKQAMRAARIGTPLGEETLALRRLDGHERLSTPFSYSVECLSEDAAIDLDSMLGQNITIAFDIAQDGTRYINGIASRVAHIGSIDEYAHYSLKLRPWLWLLGKTSDCRIFAGMSVPDILEQVFTDNGFSDYENRLFSNYPKWNYCVQYRETDFAFVSRLMEHEGIYYYSRHEDGKNILVLSDSASAHDTVSGYAEVPHYPADLSQSREQDHMVDWRFHREVNASKYVMNDFGFDDPKRDLLVTAASRVTTSYDQFELYEFPGAFPNSDSGALERSYGEEMATRRMQAELALHEVGQGRGNVRGLNAGNLFSLVNCEREDQNREYLIVDSRLSINMDAFFSGADVSGAQFETAVECIDSQRAYRPPRITDKPRIRGPQTAIVVGPAGEEIWTDQHGRIKLQFHWDRYGSSNENSSRWVRVSQAWAGEKWGSIHIPRIGQEVIVEYIDGDPDRPIVTGRVYNGHRPVPYDLPGNATQSGIKSRSSLGGSPLNFNEIRMEDKKGSEELYVHAEKNQTNIVENDESTSVGHDRSENVGNDETISIGNNRTETVGVNETITIGSNRTEKVGTNETITIGKNRSESVGVNEQVSIGSNRKVTVGKNKSETVSDNKSESIGKAKDLAIGSNYSVKVGQDVSETYGGQQTTKVVGNHHESIGKKQSIDIADDLSIAVGKNILITAGDSVVIKTGKSSISMKKDGTITIQGKDITINGSGAVNVKATKDIVMKGKKILQN